MNDDQSTSDIDAPSDADVDTHALFCVLADARRRFVLARIQDRGEPLAIADVAEDLVAWEREADRSELSHEAVRTATVALHHVHVPMMADAGLVRHDRERNAVAPVDGGRTLASLESLPTVG